MAVTHGAATRNNIADAVLADIDAGAGAGKLIYRTSGDVEVATLTFSNPAGTVSGAVLTFAAITSDTSATGGTVAKATLEDDSANMVCTCSVGTSGADIIISSTTIGATDTVSCSSLTYTAPV